MKLSEMSKNSQNEEQKQDKKQQIRHQYEELQNHSSDELRDMLSKEVASQKMSGTFDYEALRSSVEKIKGYLPAATYQNMLEVLESLK